MPPTSSVMIPRISVGISSVMILAAACTGSEGSAASSPSVRPSASQSVTQETSPAEEPQPEWLSRLDGQQIRAEPFGDWVLVAFHRVWVLGVDGGIGFYDVSSGELIGTSSIVGETCAAPDDGFGSIRVPTCGEAAVHRIDPQTGEVIASISVKPSDFTEASVGAGEGGVWIVGDGKGCRGCMLVRIDPVHDRISRTYHIPEHGANVRAGLGGIWITYPDSDVVLRVDPASGQVVDRIKVGAAPAFFDVGLGGVWVMNQSDGSVSHIDPNTDRVVETIEVDDTGISGGDLTVGEGSVWVRATLELVAVIDPQRSRVVERIGPALGSGSASAGDGQLWISAHDQLALYRVPLA
jgi:virginiamycin B lyase